MRKKHFEALALALSYAKPLTPCGKRNNHHEDDRGWWMAYEQWEEDVKMVAGACALFSESFDKDRFFAAAGLTEVE